MDAISLKIFINCFILFFVLIISAIFILKLKFKSTGYKYVFLLYILFWIPIILVRPYRGTIQKEIDDLILWLPLMMYGFIGIFARPIMDFFSLFLKNRKTIIQTSLLIIFITYLPIIFIQNTTTNIIQTLGVGIGASIIGTYELLFKEQFGKSKSFLTVSILAVPPLIADFITAPIQSIILSFAKKTNEIGYDITKLSYLWIIGICVLLIVFTMSFFIKENKEFVGNDLGNQIIKDKNNMTNFLLICLIGSIILFIKFGNSGSVGTTRLHELGKITNSDVSGYEGYLSTVFSLFQLFGTFLFGFLIIRNVKKINIFLIGLSLWTFYHFISIFFFNPIFFISIHSINGFAYGILYNLFLAYVLSLSFNKNYLTPMGVYQSILAIGITLSNFFTSYISSNIRLNIKQSTFIIDVSIIFLLLISLLLFLYVNKKINKIK